MGGMFLPPLCFYIFIYICFDPFILIIRLNYLRDKSVIFLNTLRTGDADLRFYITTVQDG